VPWKVPNFADFKLLLERSALSSDSNRDTVLVLELARFFGLELVLRVFDKRWASRFHRLGSGTGREPVLEKYLRELSDKISPVIEQRIRSHGVDFRAPFGDTLLISAVRMQYAGLARELIALGADIQATSSTGMTPLQVLLWELYNVDSWNRSKPVRKQHLTCDALYRMVAPPSRRVRIGTRLIKLDLWRVEYLLVEIALMLARTGCGLEIELFAGECALRATAIVNFMYSMGGEISPLFWRRNTYLSGVMARNEVERVGPYNKQLFFRLERGAYVLNPMLDLEVGQTWVPWYEAVQFDKGIAAVAPTLTKVSALALDRRREAILSILRAQRERLRARFAPESGEQVSVNG
jgi:hypothetical protein